MKTTKKSRRIIALAAALSLSACMMAMPAGMVTYADGAHTITIKNGENASDHSFSAYRIFSGTVESVTSGETTTYILKNPQIDTTAVDRLNLITALKADGSPVKTYLTSATPTDAEVAEAFEKLTTAADKKALAEIIGRYVKTATKTAANGKISGLDDGYYLIADTKGGSDGYSSIILRVAGDEVVQIKSGAPTVTKKVKEDESIKGDGYKAEAGYNDVADYCIGESVPFKLYGTMPSNLDDYSTYYYKFTDTLAEGLTPPNKENITVKIDGTPSTEGKNMRIKVIGQQIAVSFEDIKALGAISSSSVVTVEYSAVLNEKATIGLDGNKNTVHLSYLNNPNVEYKPDTNDNKEDRPNYPDKNSDNEDITENKDDNPNNDIYVQPDGPDNPDYPNKPGIPGTPGNDDNTINNPPGDDIKPDDNIGSTPEDEVIVFTYQLDVLKKDAKDKTIKLKDAEFKLKNVSGKYAKLTNGLFSWEETDTDASTFKSGGDGKLSFVGLDEGKYTLIETKAPLAYNSPGDNNTLEFTIKPDILSQKEGNQDWDGSSSTALTDLKVTKGEGLLLNNFPTSGDNANTISGNIATGIVSFDIYNTKGATLPSTGGMGTTIFLLTGGTAAGAAAILYITKKRTSANAE